ncbi:hypothetical protein [Parashewanella tropica]|uniref:hypothetical protein n=1 Tax=Parashewanella tropica TaxID=2547970 RepID=UPI001059CD1B|nr:hypothetical protein [Parashewanella tropica]
MTSSHRFDATTRSRSSTGVLYSENKIRSTPPKNTFALKVNRSEHATFKQWAVEKQMYQSLKEGWLLQFERLQLFEERHKLLEDYALHKKLPINRCKQLRLKQVSFRRRFFSKSTANKIFRPSR